MDDQFSIYVGVDWATEAHQICILDAQGTVLKELSVEHTGKAISGFLQWLNEFTKGEADKVAVAIEVPRGAVVEAFLERNYAVFSINPKQLDRFRDRHERCGSQRRFAGCICGGRFSAHRSALFPARGSR